MGGEARDRRRLAIDGPAASGKSAVGTALAGRLGFPFIDTGAIYRALTWLALEQQIAPDDAEALTALAGSAALSLRQGVRGETEVTIDGSDATPHLRAPAVEQAVSAVSAVPGVRDRLIAVQRGLANARAVVAGRDIGSVVLPDAEIKVYLDASPEERARRRARDLEAQGIAADPSVLLQQIRGRDALDSSRPVAPLRAAPDALVLITDDMSLQQVVERILDLAYQRWPDLALRAQPQRLPG